jgi:hypothetical protein
MKKILLVILVFLFGCGVGLQGIPVPKSYQTKVEEAEAVYSYLEDNYEYLYAHPEVRIDDYRERLERDIRPLLDEAKVAAGEGKIEEFCTLRDKIIYEFNHLEYVLFEIDPIGGGGGA